MEFSICNTDTKKKVVTPSAQKSVSPTLSASLPLHGAARLFSRSVQDLGRQSQTSPVFEQKRTASPILDHKETTDQIPKLGQADLFEKIAKNDGCQKRRLGSWSSSASSANSVHCDPQAGVSINGESRANQREKLSENGCGDRRENASRCEAKTVNMKSSSGTAQSKKVQSPESVKRDIRIYNQKFKSLCSVKSEPLLFSSEYSILSNLYLCPVRYKDEEFASLEHAYQVKKARFHGKASLAKQIQRAKRGNEAEQLGSQVEETVEWTKKRNHLLRKLLLSKCDLCPQFKLVLQDTGDRPLWHAVTCPLWGVGISEQEFKDGGRPHGDNLLGVSVMKLRRSLLHPDSDKASQKKPHKKLKYSNSPKGDTNKDRCRNDKTKSSVCGQSDQGQADRSNSSACCSFGEMSLNTSSSATNSSSSSRGSSSVNTSANTTSSNSIEIDSSRIGDNGCPDTCPLTKVPSKKKMKRKKKDRKIKAEEKSQLVERKSSNENVENDSVSNIPLPTGNCNGNSEKGRKKTLQLQPKEDVSENAPPKPGKGGHRLGQVSEGRQKTTSFGRGRVCFKLAPPGRRQAIEQQMRLQDLQEEQLQSQNKQESTQGLTQFVPESRQQQQPTVFPTREWRKMPPKWGPRRKKNLQVPNENPPLVNESVKYSTPTAKGRSPPVAKGGQRVSEGASKTGMGFNSHPEGIMTSTPLKPNNQFLNQANGNCFNCGIANLETTPSHVEGNSVKEKRVGDLMIPQNNRNRLSQISEDFGTDFVQLEANSGNQSVSDITLSRCNIAEGVNDGFSDSWLSNKDSSNPEQFNCIASHQGAVNSGWMQVNSRISPAQKCAPISGNANRGSQEAVRDCSVYPHSKWATVSKSDQFVSGSKGFGGRLQQERSRSDTNITGMISNGMFRNSSSQLVSHHGQSLNQSHGQSYDQTSDQLSNSSVDWFDIQDSPTRYKTPQGDSSSCRSAGGATGDSKLHYGSWEEYNQSETGISYDNSKGSESNSSITYNSWEEYNDKNAIPITIKSVTPESAYMESRWRGQGGRLSDPGPLMRLNNEGRFMFGMHESRPKTGDDPTNGSETGPPSKRWGRRRLTSDWIRPGGGWMATKSASNLETAMPRSFGSRLSLNSEELAVWSFAFSKKYSHIEVPYIDTHCHIDFLFRRTGFRGTYAKYRSLNEMTFPASYAGCVAVFCEPHSFKIQGGLWRDILQEDKVWGAFGCHPKCATDYTLVSDQGLQVCLSHPKTVALGEIGLDYSGKFFSTKDKQKLVFVKQLQMALDRNLPLVIHCREAEDDCFEIMRSMVPKEWKIHRHCFTRDWKEASRWVAFFPNLFVGLTPLVTYSSAVEVHEVAENLPLDRLLLETDAPYFVPRGVKKEEMKFSHPGLAVTVADEVARLKGVTIHEVLKACRENTRKMYGI